MVEFAEFKRFFIGTLIGSLIIAALVAVVAVLINTFNEVTSRAFLTLFMVVLHSFISLAFIWEDEKQGALERLSFFVNTLFVLVVASFFISIFGIWNLIPGETVWNLYQTLFILAFASLHGNILAKALNKEDYMDIIVYVNYLFMAVVVLMLMPIVFLDNALRELGQMFFRLLAAAGIIDGTLSILTIIFYKLYMKKHPKVENQLQWEPQAQKKSSGLSIWVWILLVYLIFQILLLPLLGLFLF